jgi:3-oxoacyl-[acyl-carrier-protein] synthase II
MELLISGRYDVVITGGTEAAVDPMVVTAFARMGALSRRLADPAAASRPFDCDRDGFVIGKGSGIVILEREADARARGARIRAKMAGFGASADAHHMTAPDPDGASAARAIRAALDQAGVAPDEVDHVNAHGTSTPLNDITEARLLRTLIGDRATVTSTKGVTGHTPGRRRCHRSSAHRAGDPARQGAANSEPGVPRPGRSTWTSSPRSHVTSGSRSR